MSEVIEVSIVCVTLDKLVKFLVEVFSSATLQDYQIANDSTETYDGNFSMKSMIQNFEVSSNGAFYFNLTGFELEDAVLSKVGIQVVKYDNEYDLNIHFLQYEISENVAVSILRQWVCSLAQRIDASDYYCGYEPAMDASTQFFSKDAIGPLKWAH